MFRTAKIICATYVSLCLALVGSAQSDKAPLGLISYSNDSLGFTIDLPCVPEWQKPTIPGSVAVLVCATTTPIVVMHSEHKQMDGNEEFDAYVKKQVQAGDMPYEVTRQKLDGHKARRVRLSANGQDVELWIVAARNDQLLMFSFVQPSGLVDAVVPRIVESIRLK